MRHSADKGGKRCVLYVIGHKHTQVSRHGPWPTTTFTFPSERAWCVMTSLHRGGFSFPRPASQQGGCWEAPPTHRPLLAVVTLARLAPDHSVRMLVQGEE